MVTSDEQGICTGWHGKHGKPFSHAQTTMGDRTHSESNAALNWNDKQSGGSRLLQHHILWSVEHMYWIFYLYASPPLSFLSRHFLKKQTNAPQFLHAPQKGLQQRVQILPQVFREANVVQWLARRRQQNLWRIHRLTQPWKHTITVFALVGL